MSRKSIFVIIFGLLPIIFFGQRFSDLKLDLLRKSALSNANFEISMQGIEVLNTYKSEANQNFDNWLITKKNDFDRFESNFFKVHFYIRLAKAIQGFQNNNNSYHYVDTAFTFFNAAEFPGAFLTINKLGSNIASSVGNYSVSARYMENILRSDLYNSDSLIMAESMLTQAKNYLAMHQYDKSMHYCKNAYSIFKKMNFIKGVTESLLVMYTISDRSSNDPCNMDYLNRALEIALKSGNSSLISSCYSNLGLAHSIYGNHPAAIMNYIKSRKLIQNKGGLDDLSTAINQYWSYTNFPDSIEKARELSEYILKYAIKNNFIKLLNRAYLIRASCFAKQGIADSSEYYLDKSEHFLILNGNPEISSDYYYKMYEVSMDIPNSKRALIYLNKSLVGQKNRYLRNNTTDLNSSRSQFDYQLQKEKIEELNKASVLAKVRNAHQKTFIYSIIIVLLVGLGLFLWVRIQYKRLHVAYHKLFSKNLDLEISDEKQTNPDNISETGNVGIYIRDEEEIYLKIKELFEKHKGYLQKDISIVWLADELGTNTTYLSSVINHRFEMSFKSLLNKFRIEEAQRLLVSEEYSFYSIEGIANEVGYQSRSTFYQVFRFQTGVTPTEYIQNYKATKTIIDLKEVQFNFDKIKMN